MLNYFNQVIAPANSELAEKLGVRRIEVKHVHSVMRQIARSSAVQDGKQTIHVDFDTPILDVEYEEDSPREEALRDIERDYFNHH